MKPERQRTSFSAYTGSGETPGDFAASRLRKRSAGTGTRTPRRGRRLLIVLALMTSLGLAGWQYHPALHSLASAAGEWSLNLPVVEGSPINRPVNAVRIESPLQRVREEDLRNVLARYMDEGFFSLDVRALKQALEDNPWVEHVSVRRIWPDTLELDVTERRAIARWGNTALLSDGGEVFSPAQNQQLPGLPRLEGPAQSQQRVMSQYQAFSQLLAPAGLRIQSLTLDERDSWRMVLESGTTVNLGREALVERLQRLITVYRARLSGELESVAAIDLRYRNGLAVRRRQENDEEVASL